MNTVLIGSTRGSTVDVLLLTATIGAPLVVAVAAMIRGWCRAVAWASVAASAAILTCAVFIAVRTTGGTALVAGGVLRADALTAVMLLVIGAVAVIATWAGVSYIDDELETGHTDAKGARLYAVLIQLFLAAMVLAVLASNLGVLWAAIEATTIVTAFLVGHRRTPAALEATWKYVMICSVGIALAYLGTILVYYAGREAGLEVDGSLDWTQLVAHAGELDPGVMRLAFALLVIGFGTKAGLVPLHSWLPDAHSQAPAPVSALMSGVLLSVAVYALLRYHVIAVAVLSPTFVRALLLTVALASLVLAASLLLAQRDYKRLLAYSSIEHMGLVVIGVAIGTPLALAALLLHILGHGIGKAVLFCGSGQILIATGTTRIAGVRGLLMRRPVLGATFALGLAALIGLPPFSLFASELGLARAGAQAGLGWVIALTMVLLLVVFVAITVRTAPMLFGSNNDPIESPPPGTAAATAPLVTGLVALALIGVFAWPLGQLLHTAAEIAGTR